MKFLQTDPLTGITYAYELIRKNKNVCQLFREKKLIAQFKTKDDQLSKTIVDQSTTKLIDEFVATLATNYIKEGKV